MTTFEILRNKVKLIPENGGYRCYIGETLILYSKGSRATAEKEIDLWIKNYIKNNGHD